jgi:hypothetical protein
LKKSSSLSSASSKKIVRPRLLSSSSLKTEPLKSTKKGSGTETFAGSTRPTGTRRTKTTETTSRDEVTAG